MSTHPAYDPDPQADVPAETSVRRLIDDLIRTAAPRLGKVAVARIALPLTDAVIALRAEVRAEAEARVAAAFPPVEVGEVITTTSRLDRALVGTVLRDADGVLFERFRDPTDRPGRWYSTGIVGAYDLTLPARVLDIGVSS